VGEGVGVLSSWVVRLIGLSRGSWVVCGSRLGSMTVISAVFVGHFLLLLSITYAHPRILTYLDTDMFKCFVLKA